MQPGHLAESRQVHTTYCGCDIYIHSALEVSDEISVQTVSDEAKEAWEAIFVQHRHTGIQSEHPRLLLRQHLSHLNSIPETRCFDREQGDTSPDDPAIGVATKIVAKDGVTQTPPLLSRLIQGHLEHAGIEACPIHHMVHGVRDPGCDHCKRALGPLIADKGKSTLTNLYLRLFRTSPSPGEHRPKPPSMCVELRRNEIGVGIWDCSFEDLRALTGGSRPPILRLHSDKAREFLLPVIRPYLSQQCVSQTVNSGYDPHG